MSPLEIPIRDPRLGLFYPLYETIFHKVIVWLAHRSFRLFMDLKIYGLENLPKTGAVIIAANHLVNYDVFPLQLALPRMIFFMGKAELFQIGILHFAFRNLGGFPVYRGEKDAWAMDHARKVLITGQVVAMFPEGTRSRGKGLSLARPGAAKLAIEMGCPMIAVSVDGIQRLFKKFPQRTEVNVVIAPPIFPNNEESPLVLMDKLMFTMAKNLPNELRGVYAELPKGFN